MDVFMYKVKLSFREQHVTVKLIYNIYIAYTVMTMFVKLCA